MMSKEKKYTHKEKKEVKKITVELVLRWFFGVIFLISGLAAFIGGDTFSISFGIFFILIALILLPPINTLVKKKFMMSKENKHTHKEKKEVKQITVGLVSSWFFGVIFFLYALVAFSGGDATSISLGIIFILIALILLPPINTLVKNKWNFELSTGLKIILVIALFAIAASIIGNAGQDTTNLERNAGIEEPINTPTTQTESQRGSENQRQVMNAIVEPELITINGTGTRASNTFPLEKGLAIFEISNEGEGHFAVKLYRQNGAYIELLANDIDYIYGSKLVSIERSDDYRLQVTSDDDWEVSITQPRNRQGGKTPVTLSGFGGGASEFFYLERGLRQFTIDHTGKRHFSMVLYAADGDYIDLLVNEIGGFEGSVLVPISSPGNYILDVSADGKWNAMVE